MADASGKISVNKNNILEWEVNDVHSILYNPKDKYGQSQIYNVPGYFGGEVKTNLGLASFITSFQELVRRTDRLIINATEGGAKIEGMKQLTLRECIKRFMRKPLNKKVLIPLLTLADDYNKLIGDAIPLLEKDIDNLNDIIEYAGKGLSEAEKVKDCNPNDTNNLKKHFKKNREYS